MGVKRWDGTTSRPPWHDHPCGGNEKCQKIKNKCLEKHKIIKCIFQLVNVESRPAQGGRGGIIDTK